MFTNLYDIQQLAQFVPGGILLKMPNTRGGGGGGGGGRTINMPIANKGSGIPTTRPKIGSPV